MKYSYRKFENFHILLWLIKDFCWISDQKIAGMMMIIPTVSVAVYLTYRSYDIKSDFLHNLAVVCWILANSIWMFGEFFLEDTTRPYAMVFFVLGLLTVGYHYFVNEPFWKKSPIQSLE